MNAPEKSLPAIQRPTDLEYDRLARTGMWLAAAEGHPRDEQAGMAAALRLLYARELGLPPFAAAELSIIAGRLVVSADLLHALAQKAGYRLVAEDAPDACRVTVLDGQGAVLGSSTFTMADAQRAGLVKRGGAWVTYPQRMLKHRAMKNAVRDILPAVALGMITEDEALELEPIRQGPVEPERAEAPQPPPPDAFEQAEAEADWRAAAAEAERSEELRKAHATLALLLEGIEAEGKPPPQPHADWTAYSRALAAERWGVESRGELEAAQVRALVEEVDRAAGVPL